MLRITGYVETEEMCSRGGGSGLGEVSGVNCPIELGRALEKKSNGNLGYIAGSGTAPRECTE